ncbi:type II toxin-antitoxin system RatA family toxin [Verrucomicrobiota bacterium sgz303538]
MHTGNSVHILAPREKIFELVSDLSRWPELLPHYRYVRFLGKEQGREIVRMAATRPPGIPIAWVSAYDADAQRLELRFEHLQAWTKGMKVIWTLTPTRDGTRVEIIHDLSFRIPFLRWLAEPIIGRFFIENIANKTLRTFKELLERETSSPALKGEEQP